MARNAAKADRHEWQVAVISVFKCSPLHLRSRVQPALQSHLVCSIKVWLKGSFHRLMLRDNRLAIRVAEMAFEHKPGEKMGCRLGKSLARIFRQFASFHVIGDDGLPDFHSKSDRGEFSLAKVLSTLQNLDILKVSFGAEGLAELAAVK